MFKFLKNFMNSKDTNLTNNFNSVHRILKTDIKEILTLRKMKLYLGVVASGELKNVFGNFLELSQHPLDMLVVILATPLIMKSVQV